MSKNKEKSYIPSISKIIFTGVINVVVLSKNPKFLSKVRSLRVKKRGEIVAITKKTVVHWNRLEL